MEDVTGPETREEFQSRVNEFLVNLLFGWEMWAIVGGALGILLLVCLWPDAHREQRQTSAWTKQALQDDKVSALLAKGGGMDRYFFSLGYYEAVLPYGADASRLVAYYKATMQHPVASETRSALEVLQTSGVVYTRVYVGDRVRIDEAFRKAHPELHFDFDLQNRPSPQR